MGNSQIKPEAGEAMTMYETIMVIFASMTFVVALVTLMILIAKHFSKKK